MTGFKPQNIVPDAHGHLCPGMYSNIKALMKYYDYVLL